MQVESSVFQDSRSQDSGGAISAVGAIIHIKATRFVNSSSLGNGGGAISATHFVCYSSTQVFPTAVDIKDSSFEGCFSRGSGGAVMVSSRMASVNISASLFMACISARQGGALASMDGGLAKLVDSIFVFNSASGHGGGALYSENAQLVLHGVSAHGNTADAGGGGVLYWLGQLPPIVISWCSQGAYPDPASVCSPTSCSLPCQPCQKGTYLTGSGAESQGSCLPCEAGFYSTLLGSTASTDCLSCSAGSYSTTKGSSHPSFCVACEPGSYAGLPAATTCRICEPGTYSSKMGSSTCLLCPAGTYLSSGASQQDACMECPGGSISYEEGSVGCTPCDAGYYSRPMSTSCTTCPAGTFASATSLTVCELCGPGQFSDPGVEACAVCRAGTFSIGFGVESSESCSACSDGLFSGRGASRCNPIDGFRAGPVSNVFSDGSEVTEIILPLPFPFSFYGEEYWNVTVSKYGLLGMGECTFDYLNVMFPSYLEQSIVAVFWQNLAAQEGSGFIQWSDNDTITFQWTDWSTVSWAGIGGSLTFQISLMRNGSFLLSYIELDGLMAHGEMATVGFQGGDFGLTISFCSAYPGFYSGLCYIISPDSNETAQYSVKQYKCPDNARLVVTCEPGKFLGPDYKCALCSAGTYQTGTGMQNKSNCSLCVPGTFSQSSGATAAIDCSECAGNSSVNRNSLSEATDCMEWASLNESVTVSSIQEDSNEIIYVIQLETGQNDSTKQMTKSSTRCVHWQLSAP